MSSDGETLSVIENPAVVTPTFDKTSGLEDTKDVPSRTWFHSFGHRLVRCMAALCAVGLLGGLAVGVWFLVKLLLRPSSTHSPVGLGDTKETSFCNVTEDISISDSRKVFYRISPENSILEIQLSKVPTWLPVCYERWNSSLGTLVCRQLGYLSLTKHKGVNLTDIGPSYTDGFIQIAPENKSGLENMWQLRESCITGKVIALQCSECGTRAKLPRIIGGVEAALGRWPWQVSLYYSNRHNCGGSIITRHWVVTAAHCVHNYRLPQVSNWVVYAGLVTRSSAKMTQHTGYAVEKIIYNKNYNHRSHDSDIALMKLRTPLNFSDTIRPVCLPQYDYDLPGGTQCWISGWGYTQPDGIQSPDTLKEAPVPIISTKKCNSSCMYNGEITSRMLCAGYTEGKVDACQGDSGGPLVCQDDNVWRLVGVVSWGTGCAEPNHPGVYTKVAEFLGWIYDMIEDPNRGQLYINLCSWKRVPAPQHPSKPLPLCAGKLETEDKRGQGPYTVLDVAVNPGLLKEHKPNETEMNQLYMLLLNFVQQQHNLKLSQHYTPVSPRSTTQDLHRRLGLQQWPNMGSKADSGGQIACQTPASLLQKISSLHAEKEDEILIAPEHAEPKKKNLIQVISSTLVQPERPEYQLEVRPDAAGSPRCVELTMELPKVSNMSECQLRISKDDVLLEVEDVYHLLLDFPNLVDEDSATAVFNKRKRQLTLRVNIL